MVGIASKPKLKTKGMETFGVCSFLVDALVKYKDFFPHQFESLHESGTLLLSFLSDMKSCPAVVPVNVQQSSLGKLKRFLRLTRDLSIEIPKTHLVLHMILRMGYLGNPFTYHTFEDDGVNKILKKVLRNVHQCTFETMALAKMSEVLTSSKRRRG